ncbi:hypothetical protein [Nannocystis pusilla]|uniref:Outer membrane protein beta-barrel domain-containing protein n=1 Tax=Nannocystis pusilla TaxID=889268 RepID=A0ABS7TNE3_9BACT|nr:hypothetical protein [Nannocystis pusilla]MBZ5709705.1 hypothetical protein [Nannocystis pusilla]
MGIRIVCIFVVALAFAGVAHAGPPWGTDDASFQATYLQPGDLTSVSDLSGDWARAGCEPGAAQFGCTHWGKKLWTAKDASVAMWQVHDLRWVFPNADAAQRFLQSSMDEMAEGLPAVTTPPAVGADTKMFTAQGDTYGIGIEVIMYNLVFRVDNVVVKLFVAQGPEAKQRKVLTPLMVAALGQKAVERIRAAEPRGVAVAPVPVSEPVPATPVEPVPVEPAANAATPVEPTPEPEPEPEPRRRSSGRLAGEIKDYWRSGVSKPYIFVGGAYSRAIGSYTLPGGLKLSEKNAFDISLGFLLHPRVYFQVMFHRDVWQVPKVEEVLVRRLEFIYGLDLLALPPDWRVRPALMALLGFGFGFGRIDSLVGTPDPNEPMPMPLPQVDEGRGIGIGGIIGADFALHIRVTRKFELAPYAGITMPAYAYTNDFPAAERHIEGERGFGRAWRWHAGLKIGFGGPG